MWPEKGRSRLTSSAQSVTVPHMRKRHFVLAFFFASSGYPQAGCSSAGPASVSPKFLMHRHVPSLSPMRLHQHLVDLLQTHDLLVVPYCFQQRGNAEVAHLPQNTFGGAYDQIKSVVAEGVVTEPDAIQLFKNEGFDVIRIETVEVDGVGYPAADILVDTQLEVVHQRHLRDQHEVVIFWKVFEKQLFPANDDFLPEIRLPELPGSQLNDSVDSIVPKFA